MSRVDPDQENKNFVALNQLVEMVPEASRDAYGNLSLPVRFSFTSPKVTIDQVKTVARILRSGYEGGQIKVSETEEINSDLVHCDFSARFQEFHFEPKTRSLQIRYSSRKGGGDYVALLLFS